MSRVKITIFFLLSVTISCVAFKPAPPPGTPSFIVEPIPQIQNLHIDCFVIEDRLQVAFLASFFLPENADVITLSPNWPMDSLTLFVIINSVENQYELLPGKDLSIEMTADNFVLRLTFETCIELPVSGPPGPWKYARNFAFYPPFLNRDGNILQPDNYSIRFMLPEEIQPINCTDKLERADTIESFLAWEYYGELDDDICRFSE